MKKLVILKVIIVLTLFGSFYITGHLLLTYIAVISGRIKVAGAAQWQLSFILAPVPAVLGLLSLSITSWLRPKSHRFLMILSFVATILPIVLHYLVVGHVY